MTSKTPIAITLDEYEQAIEDNFEESEALSSEEQEHTLSMLKRAASNYFKKDKRITIRVYSSDLERLKILAAVEGLPYQTYLTSMIHKISTGRLKDTHV